VGLEPDRGPVAERVAEVQSGEAEGRTVVEGRVVRGGVAVQVVGDEEYGGHRLVGVGGAVGLEVGRVRGVEGARAVQPLDVELRERVRGARARTSPGNGGMPGRTTS
jgi:hypothetical protein